MSFNLNDYEPVADRIEKFWKDHPSGQIITELVHFDEKHFIVRAAVWRVSVKVLVERLLDDGAGAKLFDQPDATGYAEEIVGSGNVNRTSALENCETSAIGRALANLGYASKAQRASREEMAKVADRHDMEKVTEHARKAVEQFVKWTPEQAGEEYKAASKDVLGGKPQTVEEVDRVIEQMVIEYEVRFPETLH